MKTGIRGCKQRGTQATPTAVLASDNPSLQRPPTSSRDLYGCTRLPKGAAETACESRCRG
eukprot:3941185-Rhodomonas_salina.2